MKCDAIAIATVAAFASFAVADVGICCFFFGAIGEVSVWVCVMVYNNSIYKHTPKFYCPKFNVMPMLPILPSPPPLPSSPAPISAHTHIHISSMSFEAYIRNVFVCLAHSVRQPRENSAHTAPYSLSPPVSLYLSISAAHNDNTFPVYLFCICKFIHYALNTYTKFPYGVSCRVLCV